MSWGATGAEWYCFAYDLGLMSDILPVVSNPNARISPGSTLKKLGKVPSRYNAQRLAVGIKDWTSHQTTAQEIDHWSKEQDYGIALQTRRVRALDIDLEDAVEISAVLSVLRNAGHAFPCRYRPTSFRRLLVFAYRGVLAKRSCQRDSGIIELLADGQQCIAAGAHPAGGHYGWEGGLPESIPTLTTDELEAVWKSVGGSPSPGRSAVAAHTRSPTDARGEALDDPTLKHLFERGWVEGAGPDDIFYIACPWKDDHTGDSGPTETVYWPRGSGGYEQGHFKCLHAHCSMRTDDDFLAAVGLGVETHFPNLSEEVIDHAGPASDRPVAVPGGGRANGSAATVGLVGAGVLTTLGLTRTAAGYRPMLSHVAAALGVERFWVRLAWDDFRGSLLYCDWRDPVGEEQWRPLTHELMLMGRKKLEKAGFAAIGAEVFRDAARAVGYESHFDSAQHWLGQQRWDGKKRVDSFLQTYYGAQAGEYAQAVSAYWWTALAGRVIEPGLKADMVPILVGSQGLQKSWGLEALSPFADGYVTLDLATREADMARRMQGKLIWELSELKGLHSREKEGIKSFISERADTWVPKFQELAVTMWRRGVFFGTSNEYAFLDDDSGERRWLPIAVSRIDRERLILDRAQLWAEGAARFATMGLEWQNAEHLAQFEHSNFKMTDPWFGAISEVVNAAHPGTSWSGTELGTAIGLDIRTLTRAHEMRIAKICAQLCLTSVRPQIGKVRQRMWMKN